MTKYILFLTFLFLAGCSGLQIASVPQGAQIVVDDIPTSIKTPGSLDLPVGTHTVYVKTEKGKSKKQVVEVSVSVPRIVFSVILPIPCLIINLFKGFKASSPRKLQFQID